MTAHQQGLNDSGALALNGVSDELIGLLAALRETASMLTPHDKFAPADINDLSQAIICRNYGHSCLRLSYLLCGVVLVANSRGQSNPLLQVFWLDEMVTAKRFREYFAGTELPNLVFDGSFLKFSFDGESFDISPIQVGYLSAFLEFFVNVIPNILTKAEEQLAKASAKAVKGFATELQTELYQFLKSHLSEAQDMRRFRFISNWLTQQQCEVSDVSVLHFWQQVAISDDDGLGFKRFRTVADNFGSYVQAVAIGNSKKALSYCASIGYEADDGELNPEHLEHLINDNDDGLDVEWLGGNPKFLSKQQLVLIEPILTAGIARDKIPLTLLRASVFGDWQAQIIQATRNKAKDKNAVADKLEQGCESDYHQYVIHLKKLKDDIKKVQSALLHIFASLEQGEFFSQAAFVLEQALLDKLQQQLVDCHKQIEGHGMYELAVEQFFKQLAAFRLQNPEINEPLTEAQKMFNANNKVGFKHLPAVDDLPVYRLGGETLAHCSSILVNFLQKTQPIVADNQIGKDIFAADFDIFKAMFNKMYEV